MDKFLLAGLGFLFGIASIWLKEIITRRIDLGRKRRALHSICVSEVNSFPLMMSRLNAHGLSPAYVISIPPACKTLLSALLEVDLPHVRFYSIFLANIEAANLLQRDLHTAITSGNSSTASELREQFKRQLTYVVEMELHYAQHGPTLGSAAPAQAAIEYVTAKVSAVRSQSNDLPAIADA